MSDEQRAASGEPKGVRIEDMSVTGWAWHDAIMESFCLRWKGDQFDIVMRCELNWENGLEPLAALGLVVLNVEVLFRSVYSFIGRNHGTTGGADVLLDWKEIEGVHHLAGTNGFLYQIKCTEVWVTPVS